MSNPLIEKRNVTRWFADGRGFQSLGALCRFVAKRQIGREIRDLIDSNALEEQAGRNIVTQALVIRYGLTWEPSHGDYDHPSQDTRGLYEAEIAARASKIKDAYLAPASSPVKDETL